ncbi:unnamed protein product [Rotaria socialis]|uniref:Uncharacterized protein n=1 Tax=Rotaria socialis TaxID=392032 RepID=A0A817MFF5_9BILA|nr:unnamed protein product [Rotaria socialis]CAF3205192.1 unnamed protein product [Rotaria socialis]CAF3332519.1 unnamed protein product [Rotaria socialis]CAF3432289.1 unnamed protein product [Rotaria socialis]CAF4224166.1 unnamed protein product [Rotaria socialis]
MALYDPTPSRGGSRFGKLSSNMFFTRNTAKPKRVRHIEGLNGALICSVNDDPSVVRASSVTSLGFSRPNVPMFETPRRVERLVPPMGFWNTYGVIQDTERWRKELSSLANASGLGVEKDEQKRQNRPPSTTTADEQNVSRSGARYSTRTGRFNEGAGKSRGRTGSKHSTPYSDMLFNVPEHERDMWMLQVLCQLLGTSNLEDVQSWLVSASTAEKEQARAMITSALRGLKESERTSNQAQQPVDLNELSNFVEKQKHEEKQISQKYVKESLNRPPSTLQSINEEQHVDYNLDDSWNNLLNHNHANSSQQNTATYQHPHHNNNRRSYSSFDTESASNKNNIFEEKVQNQQDDENDEKTDIVENDEQHQRSRSLSVTKVKQQSKQLGRSSSSFNRKSNGESLQINDNDDDDDDNVRNEIMDNRKNTNEYEYENDEQQRKELVLPPIKTKESLNHNDSIKSRKIRDLKNKLSRQEEESKKQINELQSKQSRLENAIKLLTKQPTPQGKRQQQIHDDFDAFTANGMFELQKENDRRNYGRQQEINASEHRPNRSYSGIWKPDTSTLHRLQGN